MKRIAHPEIHLEHLYIGASLNVYGRQLIVESYGDEFTKKNLRGRQETYEKLIYFVREIKIKMRTMKNNFPV